MVKLIVNNSEDDIKRHKLDKEVLFMRCRNCGFAWKTTVAQVIENDRCPKCRGAV